MRTVIFTFTGTATPGDLIMLNYRGPRGGRSTIKYVVKKADSGPKDLAVVQKLIALATNNPNDAEAKAATLKAKEMMDAHDPSTPGTTVVDTLSDVVKGLADNITQSQSEWSPGSGDFKATARGDALFVMVGDLLDDVVFSADVEGAGTEQVSIEVL